MRCEVSAYFCVKAAFIGVQARLVMNVRSNDTGNRRSVCHGNMEGADVPAALNK
jgi:hypothetical protein